MSLAADVAMTDEEFDAAVGDALDLIPDELARLMSNVAVLVEDEPPPGERELLGLYEGIPLTERDGWWDAGALPDRITVYRGPLVRLCGDDREALLDEIAVTVIHEVGHHFGIDDDRLHALGWG
jgi:predicted Zn-dependent protease with MMP-like domain